MTTLLSISVYVKLKRGTSLSVTEGVAASGAVTLSGVQFVLGPEEVAA